MCPLLRKLFALWCPKLVTGPEVQQTFSFLVSLLRHYIKCLNASMQLRFLNSFNSFIMLQKLLM